MRAVRVWVLLTLTAGCHTFSGLDDFTVSKGEGGAVVGGGGGSAGVGGSDAGGGGAGEGGTTAADCSMIVADDFSSALDTTKWTPGGQNVVTQGGRLTLAWAAGANPYAGVGSAALQNLMGCSMHVELVTPPSAGGVQAFMYAGVSTDDRTGFFVLNDVLRMVIRTAGSHSEESTVAFDPVAHRWWRLREADGQVFWDTSADGITWVERFDALRPGPPQNLAASTISLGGASPGSMAGSVAFDNFNVQP